MGTIFADIDLAFPASGGKAVPKPRPLSVNLTALATALFLKHDSDNSASGGKVIAITSAIRGEGTSTVTQLLAEQLASNTTRRVLRVTTEQFGSTLTASPMEVEALLRKNSQTNVWEFSSPFAPDFNGNTPWVTDVAFRKALIESLKGSFDYILVDCPAVHGSGEISQIASMMSGVMLVVASGQSTREQIAHAKQVIELAGGHLEGCCFTRRTYPVPTFIHRRMGR